MGWKKLLPFLCGGLGGTAPLLLELAGDAKAGHFPASGFYVSMVILASLGGAVALMYREDLAHKAFLLGVGAPALITAAGAAADAAPGATSGMQALFVPVLHAAASPQTSSATRVLIVSPDAEAFGAYSVEGDVVVLVDDTWRRVHAEQRPDGTSIAMIPESAKAAYFDGSVVPRGKDDVPPQHIRTEQAALQPGSGGLVFTFTRGQQTFLGGLLEGFGMKRRAQQSIRYDAKVEPLREAG